MGGSREGRTGPALPPGHGRRKGGAEVWDVCYSAYSRLAVPEPWQQGELVTPDPGDANIPGMCGSS